MGLAVTNERRVGRVIGAVTRALAYLGGGILILMGVMTVVSITGRGLDRFGLGPVPGDYEMVANGCALAVFCFLPYAQFHRAHVTVDIVTAMFGARLQAILGFLGDVLITVAAGVILRQLWLGFGEKFPYGSDALRAALGMGYRPFYPETTYELQIPIWTLYGAALIGAGVFVITAAFTVWRSANWVIQGQEDAV